MRPLMVLKGRAHSVGAHSFGRAAAAALLAASVAASGACSSSSSSSSAAPASSTTASSGSPATTAIQSAITVRAGTNDPSDPHVGVREFLPRQIQVHVGTPVTWSWEGAIEPHSVSFYPGTERPKPGEPDPKSFAPVPASGPLDGTTAASSGLQPLGPQPAKPFTVSFSKAGTYAYYCVIHPTMVGTVVVSDSSGAQDTASAVTAKGKEELQQYLAEGEAAAKQLAATPVKKTDVGGATNWTISMGVSTQHTDVMAFVPSPAEIKAGDSVTFLNDSAAPHTASFFNGKPAIQDPSNPEATKAAPGSSPQTLNATDLFNTGLIPPNAPPGAGPPPPVRSYTYKVPTAGRYSYVCIFHASQGMTGTINAT